MHKRTRYATAFFTLLALITVGVLYQRNRSGQRNPPKPSGKNSSSHEHDDSRLSLHSKVPAVSSSRFINTAPTAQYVGPQACVECHPGEHESYLRTAHSKALAELAIQDEPADVEFFHRRSGRKYKVYREKGQMRHRESIVNLDDSETVLSDYPIKYRIGSGNHSRSYLVETNGFLVESPVTWYASKKAWAMSPGYDAAHHGAFERTADVGCLYCHAGRVEAAQDTRFRVEIHDAAISCETCHGPGRLHVAHHKNTDTTDEEVDLTIVNPAHLSRERTESICAFCHLRGAASVTVRDRNMTDFRPGLTLADFRTDYVLESSDESMKVVGHVEQMRRSPCYQKSDTLTCTTCHNPHGTPAKEDRIEYFRQTCLQCHGETDCGLDIQARKETDQQDNCVKCHMPQSPTDIPHFAFTHHRIGLHGLERDGSPGTVAAGSRLVPLHDVSHLAKIDQDRGLGLAYLELSDKQESPTAFEDYRRRAAKLLESVRQEGMRDADVDASLARLYWERDDPRRAIQMAGESLQSDESSGSSANALFILGDSQIQLNNYQRAQSALEALVKQRRQSEDWVLLGVCHQSAGRIDAAITALERATEISPSRVDIHKMLTTLYRAVGKTRAADRHGQIVEILAQPTKRKPLDP